MSKLARPMIEGVAVMSLSVRLGQERTLGNRMEVRVASVLIPITSNP